MKFNDSEKVGEVIGLMLIGLILLSAVVVPAYFLWGGAAACFAAGCALWFGCNTSKYHD